MALSVQEVEDLQKTFGKDAIINKSDLENVENIKKASAGLQKLGEGLQKGAAFVGAEAKKGIDKGVEAFKKPAPAQTPAQKKAVEGVKAATQKAKGDIMQAATSIGKPNAPAVPTAPAPVVSVKPDQNASETRRAQLKQEVLKLSSDARKALKENAFTDQSGNITLPSIDDERLAKFEGLTFSPKEWEQGGYGAKFTNTELNAAPSNLKEVQDNPFYGIDKGTTQAFYGLDEQGNPLQDVLGIRRAIAQFQVGAAAVPYIADQLNPQRLFDPNYEANKALRESESYKQAEERRALTAQREKEAGFDYLSKLHASQPTDIYGKPADFSKVNFANPLDVAGALLQTGAYGAGQLMRPSVEFGKSVARSSIQAVGALAGAAEAYTGNDPYLKFVHDNAAWLNDGTKIALDNMPFLQQDVSIKGLTQGGYYDPAYYTSLVGAALPHLAASLGAAVTASAATKNPFAGFAAAGAYSTAAETGSTYNQLIEEGRTLDEARGASKVYGLIAGALDAWEPGLIAGQRLIDPAKSIIRQAVKEEAKDNVLSKSLAYLEKAMPNAFEYVKKAGPDIARESSTETAQQFAQNLVLNFFDKNQDMWENLPDSFIGGLLGGGIFDIGEPSRKAAGRQTEEVAPTSTTPGIRQQQALPGMENLVAQMDAVAERARASRAAVQLGEKMMEKYPQSTEIPKIVEATKKNIEALDVQANTLLQQHVQATQKPVVQEGPIEVKVGQTPDGQFVASGRLSINNQAYNVAGQILDAKETVQDAIASVIKPMEQHLLQAITLEGIKNVADTQRAVEVINQIKVHTTPIPRERSLEMMLARQINKFPSPKSFSDAFILGGKNSLNKRAIHSIISDAAGTSNVDSLEYQSAADSVEKMFIKPLRETLSGLRKDVLDEYKRGELKIDEYDKKVLTVQRQYLENIYNKQSSVSQANVLLQQHVKATEQPVIQEGPVQDQIKVHTTPSKDFKTVKDILYHGTSTPIKVLDNEMYSSLNYYGQGFYTTDSKNIAQGYMKKGAGTEPTLYEVHIKDNVPLFDAEKNLSDDEKGILSKALGKNYGDIVNDISTLRQLYDEVRNVVTGDGGTADEVQSYYDDIKAVLQHDGYRGIIHMGGTNTNNAPHNVKILWNPQEDVVAIKKQVEKTKSNITPPKEKPPVESTTTPRTPVAKVGESAPMETPPKEPTPEDNALYSRVSERMVEQYPELGDALTYEKMGIKSEIENAVRQMEKDKKTAFRTAMGVEENVSEHAQTAANIVMTERALEEGNFELAARLIKNRSLRQTDFGQSIVLEKASINDNSPQKYMKELLAARFNEAGNRYLKGLEKIRDMSSTARIKEVIDGQVKEAKSRISKKKRLDIQSAQEFIASLACK